MTTKQVNQIGYIAECFRVANDHSKSVADMSDAAQQWLYERYVAEMPYGTAKARTGDPDQWLDENALPEFEMDKGLLDGREANVKLPTEERHSWLVMFDYVGPLDGDNYALDVEAEFVDEEDVHITAIILKAKNRPDEIMTSYDFDQSTIDAMKSEAIATAAAYQIFKK